ncbi:MAG: hypothetical protein ACXWYC_09145 [Actinomycetota bacterium]
MPGGRAGPRPRARDGRLRRAAVGRDAERIALGDPFDDEGTNYWESHLPFGGRAGSSSGVGRVGGRFSMERLTELKTIVIDLG